MYAKAQRSTAFLHTLHVLIWRAYIVVYLIEDVTVTNEMSQLNRHAKAACGIKIFHSECINYIKG